MQHFSLKQDVEVYCLRLPERLDSRMFEELLHYVSLEKRRQICRFRFPEDARRSLFSDLMIRRIIQEKLRLSGHQIRFELNDYGKPSLKDVPDFQFNLSHSGDWIVCAISSQPIGIDIELIQPIEIEIAKRFFARAEYDQLMKQWEPMREAYFYELWTLKESYIKAIGMGLSLPLDGFSVVPMSKDDIQFIGGEQLPVHHFKQYDLDPAYRMAVCAQSSELPELPTMLDWREVYGSLTAASCS